VIENSNAGYAYFTYLLTLTRTIYLKVVLENRNHIIESRFPTVKLIIVLIGYFAYYYQFYWLCSKYLGAYSINYSVITNLNDLASTTKFFATVSLIKNQHC